MIRYTAYLCLWGVIGALVLPLFALAVELAEPTIAVSPDTFYPLEEVLYLEGRADANAVVTVTLQKQGEKPLKFTVKSDSAGEWVVAEKTYLASGYWEVRAREQVGEEISPWSNPRVIRSIVTGINIFGLRIKYVLIAVLALVVLFLIGFILFYAMRRVRGIKRTIFKEQIQSTEDRFHHSVTEIRKDLVEHEDRDRVLRELEELEKNVDHDIEDIEKKS